MRAHCTRCEEEVEAEYSRPKARKYARYYLLVWIPIIPILPIMASEFIVSLPLFMVFLLGHGPIIAIMREKPECTQCGAYAEPLSKKLAQADAG